MKLITLRKALSVIGVVACVLVSASAFAQQTVVINPAPGSGGRIIICSPSGPTMVCN